MSIRVRRREFLLGAGAALNPLLLAQSARTSSRSASGALSMPGPYRGRVVAVHHPGSISSGQYQAEAVRAMMRRGMTELTGAGDWSEAWNKFVAKGEVVGIKVNPVGGKLCCSAPEVLREIMAGLNAAGIPNKDIVVYDRYRDQFLDAGFDKWLPEGVRWTAAVPAYDAVQQSIAGYDPDHYLDMALTHPGGDATQVSQRRSYAARFITREVDKLINLCLLKDHQSAGITMALKNLSHGLVNNVSRSHSTGSLNACGAFIPAVVALPVIRNKAVLHILDGVKGLWHGGPFGRPQFIWENRTMYFATDPVALDRIGWEVLDAYRLKMGRMRLADELPDRFSTFARKQPEHVEIAGALGLGEWERDKITLREIRLA